MNKTWRYIEENNVTASYGLASDELMMELHAHHDYGYPTTLKLYTYKDHCALCGRFQDLQAEIDLQKCAANGYGVSRRLTGGGAIIMGSNQLGICLTAHASTFEWTHIRELYVQLSEPIIQALGKLGIKASFRSRNDLEVNGKKIAGLGIHVSTEGNIQFHASLLLELDISAMLNILQIPVQKYADKAIIRTIEQRMTTIRRETSSDVTMAQLREIIRKAYANRFDASYREVPFTANEQADIATLAQSRYENEAWLLQNSPQLDMDGMSLKKTSAGLLRTYIGLKGETIKSVLITGDFMDKSEFLTSIESALKWSPLDRDKIAETISSIASSHSEPTITSEDLTEAIWLAAQRAMAANRYTYKGSCYYPKETADA